MNRIFISLLIVLITISISITACSQKNEQETKSQVVQKPDEIKTPDYVPSGVILVFDTYGLSLGNAKKSLDILLSKYKPNGIIWAANSQMLDRDIEQRFSVSNGDTAIKPELIEFIEFFNSYKTPDRFVEFKTDMGRAVSATILKYTIPGNPDYRRQYLDNGDVKQTIYVYTPFAREIDDHPIEFCGMRLVHIIQSVI
ncbi:MAG: hypothetical protein WC575_04140 [Patescibacteria group bacterium]